MCCDAGGCAKGPGGLPGDKEGGFPKVSDPHKQANCCAAVGLVVGGLPCSHTVCPKQALLRTWSQACCTVQATRMGVHGMRVCGVPSGHARLTLPLLLDNATGFTSCQTRSCSTFCARARTPRPCSPTCQSALRACAACCLHPPRASCRQQHSPPWPPLLTALQGASAW